MLSKNKAKEMKRRASQRRATHMARRVAANAQSGKTDGRGSQSRNW
jgi:hypothetical protein